MLTIWGRTSSINVQKVMWAVGELGLAHERIDAGGAFGRLDTPEYKALNPNRLVPVVVDGPTVVWESNACIRYLAATYGAGTLWPTDPAARARSDMWMDWASTTLIPLLLPIFWQLIRTPAEKRDPALVATNAEKIGPVWEILDDHLGGSAYIAGSELTIGDIPAGAAFWRYQNLDIPRPNLPNLQLWYQNLKARDAYRRHVMLPVV